MTSTKLLKLLKLLIVLTWIVGTTLIVWGFSELHSTNNLDWLWFNEKVVLASILVILVIGVLGSLYFRSYKERERKKNMDPLRVK
jgi:branched-subunit amino acid transport protein AzlD